MLSAPMLIVIFFEISIAVVTVLGFILVLSQYIKTKAPQDLYVSIVLAGGAMCVFSMIFSQVAFSIGLENANLGYKGFLLFLLFNTFFVWFHVSNIYDLRSRAITIALSLISLLAVILITASHVEIIFRDGVIFPVGIGEKFIFGTWIIGSIVGLESIVSVFGLSRLDPVRAKRYRVSKFAGVLFLMFLICFFAYIITSRTWIYVSMWVFAFFAMFFLALFSLLPRNGQFVDNPLDFLRSRILFKLIITLVLMVILSLEGMGLISITLSKRALSQSVIEGYRNIAVDTINIMKTSKMDISNEQSTLKGIAKILSGTTLGTRGAVFLVSPRATVYINRNNTWISLGASESAEISKILNNKMGGGEINIFGERVIAAYIPIENLGWYMIVGQPINYAYAKIKALEGMFIIFILFWIAITVVIGVILARNIEVPIREMKKGLLNLTEGKLNYKIKISNIDEIGELALAFNKMTSDLKESQESLIRSERLSSLGYMAAGMAHEIKNALVPLKTLTELLTISGSDVKFIEKFNELVPKEIERISNLSSDLLHYSRPIDPVFEYLDINGVVEESAKFLDIQAKKRGIVIRRNLAIVSEVKADRQKMIEVFTNIILNAIEAMNGGQIMISTYEKGTKVVVEIADNGPGIPEENLKKIFVPFFTTKKEGTGMGLAITQRIMTDHGGAIDLMSQHGKGTTFYLSFPQKT